jgi:SAM-dependent methyltransferase
MSKLNAIAEFDEYADGYDAGMDNPLKRMVGSSPEVFLRIKVKWMLQDLTRRPAGSARPHLLEYGCGHGLFLKVLSDEGFDGQLTGCDISREMLKQAERTWADRQPPDFFVLQEDNLKPFATSCDIVVMCAVLHHIEPGQRLAAYQRVYGLLKPGGRVYVFEHNPLNPVTNWVVKHTPIDKNAILLRAREVKSGLVQAGFCDLGCSYQMFFPPRMSFLHWVEKFLRWLPLGGQYVVCGEKKCAKPQAGTPNVSPFAA